MRISTIELSTVTFSKRAQQVHWDTGKSQIHRNCVTKRWLCNIRSAGSFSRCQRVCSKTDGFSVFCLFSVESTNDLDIFRRNSILNCCCIISRLFSLFNRMLCAHFFLRRFFLSFVLLYLSQIYSIQFELSHIITNKLLNISSEFVVNKPGKKKLELFFRFSRSPASPFCQFICVVNSPQKWTN